MPPSLPLGPSGGGEQGPLDVNFNLESVTVSGRTGSPEELQAFIDDLLDLKVILAKRVVKEAAQTG